MRAATFERTQLWTCPVCGTTVPIRLRYRSRLNRLTGRAATVLLFDRTAFADAFAHAWTHEEPQ
ncbi:hypothetical protein [Microcystis phage MinS1]|nr:hypothetical protein [Microcystis phage MinS1]